MKIDKLKISKSLDVTLTINHRRPDIHKRDHINRLFYSSKNNSCMVINLYLKGNRYNWLQMMKAANKEKNNMCMLWSPDE